MGLVGFDEIDESDAIELHGLIEEHGERTGSPVAARILADWADVPAAVQEGHAARLQARAAPSSRREEQAFEPAESTGGEGFVTTERSA